MSLEPALQRARLVQSLRFAATFQDLRAVINIRHQLAQETPRSRPWIRLPRPVGAGPGDVAARLARRPALARRPDRAHHDPGRGHRRGRRRGLARHDAVRRRSAAWPPYAIALDTTEGFAQETDHPDIGLGIPEPLGPFMLRHLATPIAIIAGVAAVGIGVRRGHRVRSSGATARPAVWP